MPKYLFIFEDGDMVQSEEGLTPEDRQAHEDGVVTVVDLETMQKIDGGKIRKAKIQDGCHQ